MRSEDTDMQKRGACASPDDSNMLIIIHHILKKGNDVEIRKRPNGRIAIFEIKRHVINK